MKYTLINYLILLLINNTVTAQIIPQGLFAIKETNSTTSIFADAQFRLYNAGFYSSSPFIKSDFNYYFSNNTPYTFQFQFGIYDENKALRIRNYQIPLIGFTNDLLNTNKAIMMYSFNQNVKILGYNNYKFDLYVIHNILNSNVDLNKIKTPYGKPFDAYQTAVITTTYDGTKWKTYKDGILIDEIRNTSIWNGSGNLIIGNYISNINFIGIYLYFDEIRFWDRALSANELSNNWNKPLQGDETGLKLYYNFNGQGYPISNIVDNKNIKYLKDITTNNNKGIFVNFELNDINNFYKRISETYNPALFNPIFYFDANNVDCYPGSGKNSNNPFIGTVYNLNEFKNNLQFYTNSNYNQVVYPSYHSNAGRSFGIYNIYGKSNMNTGIDGDMSITFETWVKFNSLDNNSIVSIGENYDGGQFEIAIVNNKLQINVGGNNKLISKTSFIKNQWYHIVCSYDNWQYNIYINGGPDRTGWYVGPPPYLPFTENDILVPLNIVNTPLYIGTSHRPFNGVLGILNLFNRKLEFPEIAKRYIAIKSRFGQ